MTSPSQPPRPVEGRRDIAHPRRFPGPASGDTKAVRWPISTAPAARRCPRAVVDAIADYLTSHNANTHWAFPTSAETDAALAALAAGPGRLPQRLARRDRLRREHDDADLPPGPRPGPDRCGPGDAIIVTELDHHANVDPWRTLERERGVEVRQVKMVPETGQLDWDDLDRLLTDHRTRLLAIGAASNALGHDQRRRPRRGHGPRGRGADVRRRRPLRPPSARRRPRMGLRLPRLLGVQVLRPPRRRPLRPSRADRGPGRRRSSSPRPTRPPSGWRPARRITRGSSAPPRRSTISPRWPTSPPEPSSVASRAPPRRLRRPPRPGRLAALAALGRPEPHRRRPAARPAARRPADADALLHRRRRCPPSEVSRRLAARGVFASHGDFYATTVARRLGVAAQGMVRIGCACYSTEEEIDRVVDGVREIVSGR